MTSVTKDTVTKLLVEPGAACAARQIGGRCSQLGVKDRLRASTRWRRAYVLDASERENKGPRTDANPPNELKTPHSRRTEHSEVVFVGIGMVVIARSSWFIAGRFPGR